jgi:hypothetical protein
VARGLGRRHRRSPLLPPGAPDPPREGSRRDAPHRDDPALRVPGVPDHRPERVADLLGLTADDLNAALTQTAAKTAENRRPLLTLAYAAAHTGNNLDQLGHRYAYNPAHAAHWLIIVADLGYPLSDTEEQVATDARRETEEAAVANDVATNPDEATEA